MSMVRKLFLISVLAVATAGCASLGPIIQDQLGGADGKAGLSNAEIVRGLKEALKVGINNGASQASQVDGYFGNALLKILMPPEARKVEETLRRIGLGGEVDKFVLSLN